MKSVVAGLAGALLLAMPAVAQDPTGDAAAGEKLFSQCKTCHAITAADGTDVVKGGKVGPNLYGVVGRTAGTYPDFKYSKSMVAAGEKGLAWNEADFTTYVQDPTEFLRTYLEDPKARGNMAFKLKKAEDAPNLWAYLASVAPAPAPATN
jgi:cytochrome c